MIWWCMEPLDSQDNLLSSMSTGEVTGNDIVASPLNTTWIDTQHYRASVEHGLSWAIAGRSEGKLHAVLDRAGKAVAADLSSIPRIVSARPSQTLNLMGKFRLLTPLTPRHCWGWLHRPRWCSTVLDHTGKSHYPDSSIEPI